MSTAFIVLCSERAHAVGNSATAFDVFVPPNNSHGSRRSLLVITNISPDVANVSIEDDAGDGDSDDSVTTSLTRGASYVLRMADGAINDDYGGTMDGDYFHIRSDHPVVVQIATTSNWQHDWVPGETKSGLSQGFFVYAPPTSGADNDLNVYAYEDNTRVTVSRISSVPTLTSGRTSIVAGEETLVLDATLSKGEDLIVRRQGMGLDVLEPGHTYWVRATRGVTLQYGHLGQVTGGNQARDGAGFVPSANGSSSGGLYFFSIPHNPGLEREKELRVVCFDDNTTVTLHGAQAVGADWSLIGQHELQRHEHVDYVGASHTGFREAELYRLTVEPPYQRCNVFEGNWLETGRIGTSDFASALAASSGSSVGHHFVAYVGPPGLQNNVVNPAGELTNAASLDGGYASHLYVYARTGPTSVTVTDVDTSGSVFEHAFTLGAGQYYDVVIDRTQYEQLRGGGLRPYLAIDASEPIMVMSGNFNDNWMAFFHSSQSPEPSARVELLDGAMGCGDVVEVGLNCSNYDGPTMTGASARLTLPPGVSVVGDAGGAVMQGGAMQWSIGQLSQGTAWDFVATVQYECDVARCGASVLRSITMECTGQVGSENYADVDSAVLALNDGRSVSVESFSAEDLPDYESSPPEPRVTVDVKLRGGAASALVELVRVTDKPEPDAAAVVLATWSLDPGQLVEATFDDYYPLHYERTLYYRLRTVVEGCTSLEGPIVIHTSSGSTSGLDSGLESNSRLAWQVAQRKVTRSVWGAPRVDDRFAQIGQALRVSDLSNMAPSLGPKESVPMNVSPGDLPAITNATQVFAADYYAGGSQREASILLVETYSETYEHNKALCDRASGAELIDVEALALPDGSVLRRRTRHAEQGWGEYSVELRLYEMADGTYEEYSAWLEEDYPAVAPGQRVVNAQFWSAHPGFALSLMDAFLDPLAVAPTTSGYVPSAVIRSARALGGTLTLALGGELTEAKVRVTRQSPAGQMIVSDHAVAHADLTIALPLFLDATVELLKHEHVVDRTWTSDGAWTRVDDALWGGASDVEASFKCYADETTPFSGVALAGCAEMSGRVDEFAGLARHIATPAGGIAPHEFAGLGFHLRSSQETEVCLQTDSGNMCRALPSAPEGRWLELSFDTFEGEACASIQARADVVSFLTRRPGDVVLAVHSLTLLGLSAGDEMNCNSGGAEREVVVAPGSQGQTPHRGCSLGLGSDGRPWGSILSAVTLLWLVRMRRLRHIRCPRGRLPHSGNSWGWGSNGADGHPCTVGSGGDELR